MQQRMTQQLILRCNVDDAWSAVEERRFSAA